MRGPMSLLLIALVIWVFWMTWVFIKRTKENN